MITNDTELEVVRSQLANVEAALDSIRRDIKPKNEATYHVIAEGYIELLTSLRGDIDAYMGITPGPLPEDAAVSIALEGSGVRLGETSVGLVTRLIDTFRRGLQSVVEVLENRPAAAGRRPRWIEQLCDLPLVGIAPGSVRVLLGESSPEGLFPEEQRKQLSRSLDVFFDGVDWAQGDSTGNDSFEQLPDATRQALLPVLTGLLPPRSGPVERVLFQRRGASTGAAVRKAALSRQSRDRIRHEMQRLAPHHTYSDVEGAIRSVDLDAKSFVLRDRPNALPELPCEYSEQLEDLVKTCLDCRVLIAGTIETSRKTHKEKMEVESIELIAAEEGAPTVEQPQ